MRQCGLCNRAIHEDDLTVTAVASSWTTLVHHTSCLDAAYNAGRRDGYDGAVRQIKAATHAIKHPARLSGARQEDA